MTKTILERLRGIDQRIANYVSRNRIGNLVGHIYWQQNGTVGYNKVPIYALVDLGITPENWSTGEQIRAARITVQINQDWWEANKELTGQYTYWDGDSVNTTPIPICLENSVQDPNQTYTVCTFTKEFQTNLFS